MSYDKETTELEEYQAFVADCVSQPVKDEVPKVQILWALSGVNAEVGEVNEIFEKAIRKGHPIDQPLIDKVTDEVGDVVWYISQLCNFLDIRLDDVLEHNIQKLNARRYPREQAQAA